MNSTCLSSVASKDFNMTEEKMYERAIAASLNNMKLQPNINERRIGALDWSIENMKKVGLQFYRVVFNGRIEDIRTKKLTVNKMQHADAWIDPTPFALGATRYAHAAYFMSNFMSSQPVHPIRMKSVFKQLIVKSEETNMMQFHIDLVENQIIAGILANKFFSLIRKEPDQKFMKFIDVNLAYLPRENIFYSIEEYVSGEFLKWSNNFGFVNRVRVNKIN